MEIWREIHRRQVSIGKRRTLPSSDCRQRAPLHPINRVAAFVRIRWSLSIGLGGRFPSESVAAFPRNPQLSPSTPPAAVIVLTY
jgi:hypothetical protein